jgi:hypothetical protein
MNENESIKCKNEKEILEGKVELMREIITLWEYNTGNLYYDDFRDGAKRFYDDLDKLYTEILASYSDSLSLYSESLATLHTSIDADE